ncbi:hypothetical protein K458DRAFT_414190 [Lentithecium fluviatile CBS 122367]|uniref:Rhodopsin domain-containing protein n=1 Tax=Lentithecium fluviatile CBS 122367 TaxID=1168545 RepID=A0A6G1JE68_9PLEO|nr:hypothetical protein K458DRAFT_414190 [Lentithecium fluviatile CBS 122367]
MSHYLYYIYTGTALHGPVFASLKTVITIQILRIIVPPGSRDALFWASHIVIWLNIVFCTILAFLGIFACTPVQKSWDILLQEGSCLDMDGINIAAGIVNIVTDTIVFLLPQWVICRLLVSDWRRKAQLIFVFCVATVAIAFACIRLIFAIKMARSDDKTYYISVIGFISSPEMMSEFLIISFLVPPKLVQSIWDGTSKIGYSS